MLSDTGDIRVLIITRDASIPLLANTQTNQLVNGTSILTFPLFFGNRVSAHELFLNFLEHIISSNFTDRLCVSSELLLSVAHSIWELLMRLPLPQDQYRCIVNVLSIL